MAMGLYCLLSATSVPSFPASSSSSFGLCADPSVSPKKSALGVRKGLKGVSRRRLRLDPRVVASSSSRYGLPEYGAPRPYQTPGAGEDASLWSPSTGSPGLGDLNKPEFWNYGVPSNYAAPLNYQAPMGYGAPSSYGPGVGMAEGAPGTELGQEGATLEDVKKLDAGDVGGGLNGGNGDGSGGGRGDGNGGNEGADGEGAGKKMMSMSQKLTLAYAILVGVGGLVGFAKSGSSKSLMAGGGAASILYYVYLNLPTNPVLASTIGLGISGVLLFVMGSRFKESGKVFPAGVVSLFSLIMTGGYIHGVMRTSHN